MSNQEGYRKLVSKVLEIPKDDVLPLRNIDLKIIELAIIAISIGNRYQYVLQMRFGLNGERETLGAIAEKLGVSPERIRQLEMQALTKLRHPSRIGPFRLLTKGGLERQKRVEETPLLERRIEDFELSTRTLNCLKHYEINTIGELTAMTEWGMLTLTNFGRKSLFEVRCLLKSLGLDFAPDERHRR